MQIGFNNDVEHAGVRYHIQTEDHGLGDGRITSQVFRGGQILETVTISYKKAIEGASDEEARDEEIRRRMKALHAHCFRLVRQGKYQEEAAPGAPEEAAPEEAAPEEAAPGAAAPEEAAPEEAAPEEAAPAEAAPAEAAPEESGLDKPKMPAMPSMPNEPAPAPGLGRVRALGGRRRPQPLPEAEAGAEARPVRLSDTDEDEALVPPQSLDDLVTDEVVGELAEQLMAATATSEHEPFEGRDPTFEMTPLPDLLPEGVTVAGDRSGLGDAFVESRSRGEELDFEALQAELDEVSARPTFSPMYSPQHAFRGLDVQTDSDLPGLLEALAG